MRNYRLSVIRHGSTKANENGIYIGRTDYELSNRGAAELYNKKEKYKYPDVDIVYTSPLTRCKETADILFPDTPKRIVEDLQEMYLGDFEDKTLDEIVNRDDYKEWLKGGKSHHAPNGESSEEVMARVFKALHEIIMDMMEEEIYHAAVITHAGLIVDMLTGYSIPKVDEKNINIPFGEGFELLATASMWQRSQAVELFGIVPYDRETEEN
jgi:alpha-ribazole phosphatase